MMAGVTAQPSYTQENPEADECLENIPPGVSVVVGTSKLKVQVEDVMGYSCTQPQEEQKPLPDTCIFSTPAPTSSNGGGKTKSRFTGFQSALTPILKSLNIDNKCLPQESLTQGNSLFSFDSTASNSKKTVCGLDAEYMPEVTVLDDTYNSPSLQLTTNEPALPDSAPRTPLTAVCVHTTLQHHQLSSSDLKTAVQKACPWETSVDPSQFKIPKVKSGTTTITSLNAEWAPETWADDRYFPEITLLDITRDPEQLPAGQISLMDVTQDIPPLDTLKINRTFSELSGQTVAEPGTSDMVQREELASVQSDRCEWENISKASLEGTRDITMGGVGELHTSHDTKLTSNVSQPTSEAAGTVNSTFTVAQTSSLSASTDSNTTAPISCPQNMTLDVSPSNVNSPKVESEATEEASSVTIETSPIMNPINDGVTCGVQNATFESHSLQKSRDSTILREAAATSVHPQNTTFDCNPPSKQNGTITLSETSSSDVHQSTFDKPSSPKVRNLTMSLKDNSPVVHSPELSKLNGTAAAAAATDPDAKMVETPDSAFEADPVVNVASGAGRHETKDHSQLSPIVTVSLSDTLNPQSIDVENNKAIHDTFNLDDTLDLKADSLVTSTPMPNSKMLVGTTEREAAKILAAQKKLYIEDPSKPAGELPSSNIICDRKTFLRQPAAKTLLPPPKAVSQLLKFKPASALPGRFEPLMSGLPVTRQRTQAGTLKSAAASDAPQETTGASNSYNLRATTTGSKQVCSGLRRPQVGGISSGNQRAGSGLRAPSSRNNVTSSSTTNTVPKTTHVKRQPLPRAESLPVSKRKKMDVAVPPSIAEVSTSACDSTNRTKPLKQPANTQRAVPAKKDAAVPVSAAKISTSSDAPSRATALKQPATSHRPLLTKPQVHGCANCVVLEQQLKVKSEEAKRLNEGCNELEEQLKMKSEEIQRLKEELLKYRKEEDE